MSLKRWTLPRDYMGAEWPKHYVWLGQHRDSGALTRSNFQCALAALEALPEWDSPGDTDDDVSRLVVRESHWAVGWVEWIAIHETDAAALAVAQAIDKQLENYPVVDEGHFSELEYTEACEYWERMSVRDRLDAIEHSHAAVSMFAARRSELPQDDGGYLLDYLRG